MAVWYNILYDLPSSVYLNKKIDNGNFKISLKEWKKSLSKNSFEAVWSWKDPMPFIAYLWNLVNRMKDGGI